MTSEDTQLRVTALSFAAQLSSASASRTAAEVLQTAAQYLAFINGATPLTGELLVDGANGGTPVATPKAKTVKATKAVTTVDTTVQPAAAVAPAATATPTPEKVPAPTTIQVAAESLKALVQNQSVGVAPTFGRQVAIDLLAKFGVTQLSQIPAPKLAAFKAECDAAAIAQPAATVDPTAGLL